MKFYKNLYIGDTIRNPGKTQRKLKRYAKLQNVYVIAYMAESGQLSIYHNLMFRQRYYRAVSYTHLTLPTICSV